MTIPHDQAAKICNWTPYLMGNWALRGVFFHFVVIAWRCFEYRFLTI